MVWSPMVDMIVVATSNYSLAGISCVAAEGG